MRAWWPVHIRDAWDALTYPQRSRGRLVIETLEVEYRGCVVGQGRLVRRLASKYGMAQTSALRTLYVLEDVGILRRQLSGGRIIVRVPEHLLDASRPACEEDLLLAGLRGAMRGRQGPDAA